MEFELLRKLQAKIIDENNPHQTITAKDAMIKSVILNQNDEIELIIKQLKKENINNCIIIDDDENFIGLVTIENLLSKIINTSLKEPLVKILDTGYQRGINYTTAKDHLNKKKIFVSPQTKILDVIKLINKNKINYLPVIDEKNKIKGVITPSSLLNLLSKH